MANILAQSGFVLTTQGGSALGASVGAQSGGLIWVVVETDANGNNDFVYITALIQCLLLNTGESPFYADAGIPAYPDVVQQVFPDYYVTLIQQQYAQYFASLQVSRTDTDPPTYGVYLMTHSGVIVNANVPIPI